MSGRGSRLCLVCVLVSVFASHAVAQRAATPTPGAVCKPSGEVIRLADLPEGSGVAASRRTPGVLWAHNDSGLPVIFALSEQGRVAGRVRITGAEVADWEDVAVGTCEQGTCLYIADIGDNDGKRGRITVYRVPEPSPQDASTSPAEAFHAKYPDGAHDAEALFVTGDSGILIVTKGDPGPIALYRFPRPLQPQTVVTLERVGAPAGGANVGREDRPTGADVSRDGRWVAVRTTRRVAFYRTEDLTAGRWREAYRVDVTGLKEPRGEGIAFGADGTVFLLGEAGTLGRAGTLARLACTLKP